MPRTTFLSMLAFCAPAILGCTSTRTDSAPADGPKAQLFEEMGTHRRVVTTASPEAQAYFDQGFAWMYSFNHDEAIRSFTAATEVDPDCALAWWGIALCQGPNYNDPVMTEERSAAAWAASASACGIRPVSWSSLAPTTTSS